MTITQQDAVDQFGELVCGTAELQDGDPRLAIIAIARICLEQYIGITLWAASQDILLEEESSFKPKIVEEGE